MNVIKEELKETSQKCKNGRMFLGKTKSNIIGGGLNIVSKHRKRKHLATLFFYLSRIQEVRRKEIKFEEQLNQGEYKDAFLTLNQIKEVINKHASISRISAKMNEIGKKTQLLSKKIEKEIRLCCNDFNEKKYKQCIMTALLLNEMNSIQSTIQSFYDNYIYQLIRQTVIAFVPKFQTSQNETSISLENICKGIQNSDLLTVFFNSVYAFSVVLINFHKLYSFESEKPEYKEVKQFLNEHRKSLWENISVKLSSLLTSSQITADLKLKDFTSVILLYESFCEFGEAFSETPSTILRSGIQTKCREYFRFYYKRQLEETRMILENENFLMIKDAKQKNLIFPNYESSKSNMLKLARESVNGENIYKKYAEEKKIEFEDEKRINIVNVNEEKEENSEIKEKPFKDSPEKKDLKKKEQNLVFTLTTLKMLQKFQEYIYGMASNQFLHEEFAMGIRNLYFYYMFTIFTIFGSVFTKDGGEGCEFEPTVKESIRSIYLTYIELLRGRKSESVYFVFVRSNTMDFSQLNFVERITAIESLTALIELQESFDNISEILPQNKAMWWTQLMSELMLANKEVRVRVSIVTINKSMNISNLINEILAEKWEYPKDSGLIAQSSKFTQNLMKDFEKYMNLIDQVKEFVSPQLLEKLITVPISNIMDTLVDGYSRITKCNRAGRDLMKFNYSMFDDFLKTKTQLETIPKSRLLLDYINGYYYPEEHIWSWVEENYTVSLMNLTLELHQEPNYWFVKSCKSFQFKGVDFKT